MSRAVLGLLIILVPETVLSNTNIGRIVGEILLRPGPRISASEQLVSEIADSLSVEESECRKELLSVLRVVNTHAVSQSDDWRMFIEKIRGDVDAKVADKFVKKIIQGGEKILSSGKNYLISSIIDDAKKACRLGPQEGTKLTENVLFVLTDKEIKSVPVLPSELCVIVSVVDGLSQKYVDNWSEWLSVSDEEKWKLEKVAEFLSPEVVKTLNNSPIISRAELATEKSEQSSEFLVICSLDFMHFRYYTMPYMDLSMKLVHPSTNTEMMTVSSRAILDLETYVGDKKPLDAFAEAICNKARKAFEDGLRDQLHYPAEDMK